MWLYENRVMENLQDFGEDAIGFVYIVTHIPTNQKYIGKKILRTNRKKILGKKEYAALKEERKEQGLRGATPKKKIITKESDWKTYYGSSKEVKDLVKKTKPEEWERKILKICTTKKQMSYYELKYQCINEVIERDDYLNESILGKFYKKDT